MAAVHNWLKVEVTEVQAELETKLEEVQSELETKIAEVQAEAAKSAAKAKAQRQNAHITDRERLQEDLKEMVSDRCSTSHRCAIAALSC
jgi:Skp family chaperone for outer membrane proteins